MIRRMLVGLAASLLMATGAQAADKVRIGFITTLSGPEAVMGDPMRDAANLALEMLGGKIGGLPAEIFFGDDDQKPDQARELAEKMLTADRVDFLTGMLGSNALMALYPQVMRSKTILISANAGPHQIAGAMCAPYFFASGQQTDGTAEAMGVFLNEQKADEVFVVAANYVAGHDSVSGLKRFYKGKIAGEIYTAFNQMDYQAEISQIRAAHPKAVFTFLPGAMGIQFLTQYAQSGLKSEAPVYTPSSIDEGTLPQLKDAAVGDYSTAYWAATLDNPRNKEFVAAFKKKYGYTPSEFAAGSFDAIFLIDSAVRAVNGNLDDKAALVKAMEKADFSSVRGNFAFNTNHFPIQDYWAMAATKTPDGQYVTNPVHKVMTAHKDAYAGECHMKALS
jgi:branched-chain amino acid transport system substrate-binding protein